jgi:hypothetical protein
VSSEFEFYQPNLPRPEAGSQAQATLGWLQTWRAALFHPGEETAYRIAYDPNASTGRAYLWVFIAALIRIPWIIVFLAELPDLLTEVVRRRGMGTSTVNQLLNVFILFFILSIVLAVPLFKLNTHITHWSAKQFSGSGSRDNYAYLNAAFQAPLQIV